MAEDHPLGNLVEKALEAARIVGCLYEEGGERKAAVVLPPEYAGWEQSVENIVNSPEMQALLLKTKGRAIKVVVRVLAPGETWPSCEGCEKDAKCGSEPGE